ncbi:MAG: FkbM family methyltransferase [Gemmatimonadales bacterium]
MFQDFAHRLRSAIGTNSAFVRILRPLYELSLDVFTLGKGYRRIINGVEPLYIHPKHRGLVPEEYEPKVFHYLRDHISPGSVCVNVGAHVGIFTLCMAKWAGDSGRVVAYEPNPETVKILRSNVRRNRVSDRVQVVEKGVGSSSGVVTYHAAGAAGYGRIGSPNPESSEEHRAIEIHITTLDESLGATEIDWLLIDAEGFEWQILRGGAEIIARSPHIRIVFENHPHLWDTGFGAADARSIVAEFGFSVEALEGQRDPLAERGAAVLSR